MPPQPILVTGSHRCGSTWVGKVLDQVPEICYLDEPFRPGGDYADTVDPPHWFLHLDDGSGRDFRPRIARVLSEAGKNHTEGSRPLFKDPIALLSAPWLADTFNMRVAVLVRHPAAFVYSLSRLGWNWNFNQFLDQPALMEGLFAPLADEIEIRHEENRRTDEPDLVADAALLWKCLNFAVLEYARTRRDFLFLRHEDLCLDPLGKYRELFQYLEIPFRKEHADFVASLSASRNPAEAPEGVMHQLFLNSAASINNWKRRLDPEQIRRIREITAPVADHFYASETWEKTVGA